MKAVSVVRTCRLLSGCWCTGPFLYLDRNASNNAHTSQLLLLMH